MGQVGITNPFPRVNSVEYGVPPTYPVGIGEMDSKPLVFKNSTDVLDQITTHLGGTSYGIPNWVLYTGVGILALGAFGGKKR